MSSLQMVSKVTSASTNHSSRSHHVGASNNSIATMSVADLSLLLVL